jgi:hypothetical protein
MSTSSKTTKWGKMHLPQSCVFPEVCCNGCVPEIPQFNFERKRGIVWVCDLVGSSKLFNDDNTVEAVEAFLPRFHWVATQLVQAVGGQFIKWTGDGFMAWYPVPLARDLTKIVRRIISGATTLSFLVNFTGLAVKSPVRFRLRNGVAIEQDAIETTICAEGVRSTDVIGRGVVLAFRLAGMSASSETSSIEKLDDSILTNVPFENLPMGEFGRRFVSADEKLKYFKGESYGLGKLYMHRTRKIPLIRASFEIEKRLAAKPDVDYTIFYETLATNSEWGKQIVDSFDETLAKAVIPSLRIALDALRKIEMEMPKGFRKNSKRV